MTQTDEEAAAAVRSDGWRLLLGNAHSSVSVGSLAEATRVADAAVRACGPEADRLWLDLRPDRVDLVVRPLDAALTARISEAVGGLALATAPGGSGLARPVQAMEICVDATDIPAVVPFWRAVLGYLVETRPIAEGEEMVVVDPAGQGPTVWFQQLDAPRPQRNRIHLDVCVGEDEAEARVAEVVAAGGRVVSDARARAFWVLADPEGNEVCVCTWQDRD